MYNYDSLYNRVEQRCNNPNSPIYKYYGARGISLKMSKTAFITHVSRLENAGKAGYSLDRIDNDGHYEPGNLRWVTASEQNMNKRYSKRPHQQQVSLETLRSLRQQGYAYAKIAEKVGIGVNAVYYRLHPEKRKANRRKTAKRKGTYQQ